jgi:hypothetical protein
MASNGGTISSRPVCLTADKISTEAFSTSENSDKTPSVQPKGGISILQTLSSQSQHRAATARRPCGENRAWIPGGYGRSDPESVTSQEQNILVDSGLIRS